LPDYEVLKGRVQDVMNALILDECGRWDLTVARRGLRMAFNALGRLADPELDRRPYSGRHPNSDTRDRPQTPLDL